LLFELLGGWDDGMIGVLEDL